MNTATLPPPDKEHVIDCIQLYGTSGVGVVTYHKLVRQFGNAKNALAQLANSTKASTIMPRKAATRVYKDVVAFGGKTLVHTQDDYPQMLKHGGQCPPYIHVYGNEQLLHRPCIAIVGARNASVIGQRLANEIAYNLGNAGYVIASGLARGIDTSAHVGGLKTGTIAVIAGGLDSIYPPENEKLQHKIGQIGCIVSEHPIGAKPRNQDFPRRNSIIAGLSKGILVAECAIKSGAMITARHALDIGRDVYAIPGSPADVRARGCNQLIKDGATLVENAHDIIQSLQTGIQHQHILLDMENISSPIVPDKTTNNGLLDIIHDDNCHNTPEQSAHITLPDNTSQGNDKTDIILQHLSTVPLDLNTLARAINMPMPLVQSTILELELSGKVQRHGDATVSLIP